MSDLLKWFFGLFKDRSPVVQHDPEITPPATVPVAVPVPVTVDTTPKEPVKVIPDEVPAEPVDTHPAAASRTYITAAQLMAILAMPAERADRWVGPLNACFDKYGINTKSRIAAFIANVGDECGNFGRLEEDLNYSARGLAKTWPHRYANANGSPNDLATSIGGKPQSIANITYANRMGNGPATSGDGWLCRGRCPIMITGRSAYLYYGERLSHDFIKNPDLLLDPVIGLDVAGTMWVDEHVNDYADKGDFDGVCDVVNIGHKTERVGDAIGYEIRKENFDRANKVL